MIQEFNIEQLEPSMNDLVRYMLKQTQDQDEKVALEACEFWMALAEQCDCEYLILKYIFLTILVKFFELPLEVMILFIIKK